MTDAEFDNDMEAIDEIVFEKVVPILEQIEADYPEHSAYYNVFINAMHVVFEQGWTKEELLADVEEHYEVFLRDNGRGDAPLH